MNNPIVSPWLIYLIDTVGPLRDTVILLTIITIVASAFLYIESGNQYDEDEEIRFRNLAKRFLWSGVMCGLIAIFMPSSHTIYKMIAASYVTPANIQATGELASTCSTRLLQSS